MKDWLKKLFYVDGKFSRTKALATVSMLTTMAVMFGLGADSDIMQFISANSEQLVVSVGLALSWFLRDGMKNGSS